MIEIRSISALGPVVSKEDTVSEELAEEIARVPHIEEINKYIMYLEGDYRTMRRRFIFGIVPGDPLYVLGVGKAEMSSGRNFEEGDVSRPVAIIGTEVAAEEGLEPGSTFKVGGTEVEVIGIFKSELRFGAMGVFMPYTIVQKIFNLEGRLTQIYVRVDSIY